MSKQQWTEWLKSVPADQMDGLIEALGDKLPAVPLTAVPAPRPEAEVVITRMKTEDAFVTAAPTYVDVMGLFPIYDRVAFDVNFILKGPKGVGKSLSYTAWCAHKQVPLITFECSEDTKKWDLMGSPFIVGDETVYVLGAMPLAIEIANEVGQCALAFEEINALTPQVQKQLNAMADFRKSVSLPHIGKTYRLKPGAKLWLLGSMNPAVYGGTYDLNEDLKSRFEEVEVTYPESGQERSIIKAVGAPIEDDVLTSLMMLAKETRAVGGSGSVRYPLSTRDLVRMTHNIPKVGLETTLQMMIGKFENEDKDIVLKRLPSIFKAGIRFPKKFWGAVA